MEIKNLEDVKALFAKVQGNRNSNNYFLAFKDTSKSAGPSAVVNGMLGGAAGAFAAGMVNGMENPFDALLINSTEDGLGLFYLAYDGMSLTNNVDKLHIHEEDFFFIQNEQIKNITIKKLAPLNNKIKTVCIETTFEKKYYLQVNVEEKKIPYHKGGFAEFISKYGAK